MSCDSWPGNSSLVNAINTRLGFYNEQTQKIISNYDAYGNKKYSFNASSTKKPDGYLQLINYFINLVYNEDCSHLRADSSSLL